MTLLGSCTRSKSANAVFRPEYVFWPGRVGISRVAEHQTIQGLAKALRHVTSVVNAREARLCVTPCADGVCCGVGAVPLRLANSYQITRHAWAFPRPAPSAQH